jgi:spore germination cell wall hydrolase CwlJ-like protein
MDRDFIERALRLARGGYAGGGDTPIIPPEFTSDTAGEPVNFRPLNFDALRQANAVRVTNRANPDGTTDTDPNAGFSIVSGWNDAMAQRGDPRSTVTWPDNPTAYGTVSGMFANNPEWITPHKYRQILHSARELGMRDEDVYAQPRAEGGHVDAALRFARGGYAGGGDPEIQSNGLPVISDGQINWGDSSNAADFVRADQAMQAMRSAPAPDPQAAPRIEPRRAPPVYSAPRDVPRDVPSDVPLPPARPAYLDRPYEPEGPFGALDMSSMQPEPAPSVSMGYRDVSPLFEGSTAKAPSFGAMENITPGAPEWRRGSFPQEGGGKYANRAMPLTPPAQNQPSTEELLAHLSSPQGVAAQQPPAPPEPTTDQLLALLSNPTKSVASAAIDQAAPQSRAMPAMSPQQRDLIIRTIAAESSGKTPEEGQGIAHVILNRITSGRYGRTPEKVLFAPKQFEPWADPRGSNYPMRHKPGTTKYEKAQDALEAAMGGDDITGGATLFWGPKAQAALGRPAPKWGRTGGLDIGDTRFHREGGGEVSEGNNMDSYAARALYLARGGYATPGFVDDQPEEEYPDGARPLTIHRSVSSDIPVGPMDASVWSEKPTPVSPDVMRLARSVAATPASLARQWKAPEEAEMPSGSLEEKTRAIQNILPSWNDYTTNLATQTQGAQEMRDLGLANMKSGNVGQGLLGGAQTVLGTALPALAPVGAAFDTAVQTAKRISPHAGHAVEVASLINPEMPILGASKMAGISHHLADMSPALAMAGMVPKAPPTRGMMSIPNLRDLSRDDAIAVARSEPHLIQDASGQYVGAPRGMKTPEQIQAMRDAFDKDVAAGAEGGDWYDRARVFNREISGDDLYRQRLAANEQALWSAQANPDTNLGFALNARTDYEGGMFKDQYRTGQQARSYEEARRAMDLAKSVEAEKGMMGHNKGPSLTDMAVPVSGLSRLGKKTGIYGQHLDPTVPPATTGTNDIWHARAFGFNQPDKPMFSRALTEQEHRFLDYETMLAVDRANAAKLAGRSDWTGAEIQAAPWVAGKGRALAERGNKPLEEGIAEAAKTYPDVAPKYTVSTPVEQIPGASTGLMPNLVNASDAEKAAFSKLAGWKDQAGRDKLWSELGMNTRQTNDALGMYRNSAGNPEFNPVEVGRPMTGYNLNKAGNPVVNETGAAGFSMGQAARGLVDFQEGTPWNKFITHGAGPDKTSILINMGRNPTRSELEALDAIANKNGMMMTNTEGGVGFINFKGNQTTTTMGKELRAGLEKEIKAVVPNAEVNRARHQGEYFDLADEGRISKANEGKGLSTKYMFDTLADLRSKAPDFYNRILDSKSISEKARANLDRLMASGGSGQRRDYELMLKIIGEDGLRGLLDRVNKLGYQGLPAIGAAGIGSALLPSSGSKDPSEPGRYD